MGGYVIDVAAWWGSLGAEMQTALVGGATTLAAAGLGFTAVVLQIGRQAKHAIEQHRQTEVTKLRLEIYREVETLCVLASNAEVDFTGEMSRSLSALEMRSSVGSSQAAPSPPRQRVVELTRRLDRVQELIVELIRAVERWTIVDPRLKIFQTAFNCASADITAAWLDFHRGALAALPLEDDIVHLWRQPTPGQIAELRLRAEPLELALGQLGTWLHDFRVELQGEMLGDLFQNKLSKRVPIDPRYIVVRLDDCDALERHFHENTRWGHAMRLAKDDATGKLQ